ncbi:MAG: type II toxin-antitoxin system RelE/ParE family toxin [Bacteroidota bacterium]|mgnify:CR=1 FL=1
MYYEIDLKPRALKDLEKLSLDDRKRIVEKIEAMKENLSGDVKHLTNFTPEYRLRVGNYRVLFEIEGTNLVIYRVKHRREAYQ